MSDILIDNWTLQRAAVSIGDVYYGMDKPNSEYVKLVEAIILWDNLYFIDNEYSEFWKTILWRFGYEKYLTPLDPAKIQTIQDCELLKGKNEDGHQDIVTDRALEYSIISNLLGINYLPARERFDFLQDADAMKSFYNRSDVMGFLDKEILEHYQSIVHRFGADKLKYSFPVLFDFVRYNAQGNFFIDTALQIKKQKEVQDFHHWMDNFEEELSHGNLLELERVIQFVPDLIENLTKMTTTKYTGSLQIGIAPSLSLSRTFGGNVKKPIHIDFFRTLTEFAIEKRSLHE